jgi:hypothetical protein
MDGYLKGEMGKLQNVIDFIKKKPLVVFFTVLLVISLIIYFSTSNFKTTLSTPFNEFSSSQPKEFTPLNQDDTGGIHLEPPVVPEEIGLAMKYPQGTGVSMSKSDSNSFEPGNPGPLLTDYTTPESYGESSLTDPMGMYGAGQGAHILKLKDTGNQMAYKPVDESISKTYSQAYSPGEVQDGSVLINGAQSVNYTDNFNPENNLGLQASPGQSSNLPNCETTYPRVVKYGDYCITEGDIPYGQTVNGKVNPRLVSRWESFTGDYSRENALAPIDGVLYPNLGVVTA